MPGSDEGSGALFNLIERMFFRLKDWRRLATRYDKLAHTNALTLALAATVTWWR